MKLEIIQGGTVKWTIESTDHNLSQGDIVAVFSSASMSATGFDELFFKFVNDSRTYTEAYERVEKVHEQLFNKRKYSDYNSYRNAKAIRLKK
jgi:hypothetical protein